MRNQLRRQLWNFIIGIKDESGKEIEHVPECKYSMFYKLAVVPSLIILSKLNCPIYFEINKQTRSHTSLKMDHSY